MRPITRRQVLFAGVGLPMIAIAGRWGQLQVSGPPYGHNSWFETLGRVLHQAGIARPVLIIDQQQAKRNLDTILGRIRPEYDYRIVAKSLPSIPLLEWLMGQAETNRLMLFSEVFLSTVSAVFPTSDILLGKPLPVAAARHFYQNRRQDSSFRPDAQLQWLIDSKDRLLQYVALGESIGQRLRISLEINIGLHRGGISEASQLAEILTLIQNHPLLEFAGFMGYEAHIAKAPGGPNRHFPQAMARYHQCVAQARAMYGDRIGALTLNAGGSTTYALYHGKSVAPNELAVGSAILQPADFDLPTLRDHKPAVFIATPVLKTSQGLRLPGAPGLGMVMGFWSRKYQKTFFIDGGHWLAQPYSPDGLTLNPFYGRSSNQEMLNGPANLALDVDDWIFFRPTQSESVLLQFGNLLVYDSVNGQLVDQWAPFSKA